jgi:hypothetical protein
MPGGSFSLLRKSLASPTFIVVIALAIRLLAMPIVVAKRPFHGNEPSHIAAHLAAGEGFSSPYDGVPNAPTAQQPPAYPFYLSLVFRMLGSFSRASLIFLLIANAAVGSLLPVLLYQAGRRWYGVSVGLIAAWCWATLPWIAVSDLGLSNYLFAAVFVLLWLLLFPKNGTMTARKSALCGVVLGSGILLNPMLCILWPASWKWLTRRAAVFSLAGMALMVTPWLLRNYRTMGHIYPTLRDNFGMEFYIGNHPGMNDPVAPCYSALCRGTENYRNADYPGNDPRLFAALGEQEFMHRQLHMAVSYVRADLPGFARQEAARRVGGAFSFVQACDCSAIRSTSALLLAALLPHQQHVEMTRRVSLSVRRMNALGC